MEKQKTKEIGIRISENKKNINKLKFQVGQEKQKLKEKKNSLNANLSLGNVKTVTDGKSTIKMANKAIRKVEMENVKLRGKQIGGDVSRVTKETAKEVGNKVKEKAAKAKKPAKRKATNVLASISNYIKSISKAVKSTHKENTERNSNSKNSEGATTSISKPKGTILKTVKIRGREFEVDLPEDVVKAAEENSKKSKTSESKKSSNLEEEISVIDLTQGPTPVVGSVNEADFLKPEVVSNSNQKQVVTTPNKEGRNNGEFVIRETDAYKNIKAQNSRRELLKENKLKGSTSSQSRQQSTASKTRETNKNSMQLTVPTSRKSEMPDKRRDRIMPKIM